MTLVLLYLDSSDIVAVSQESSIGYKCWTARSNVRCAPTRSSAPHTTPSLPIIGRSTISIFYFLLFFSFPLTISTSPVLSLILCCHVSCYVVLVEVSGIPLTCHHSNQPLLLTTPQWDTTQVKLPRDRHLCEKVIERFIIYDSF